MDDITPILLANLSVGTRVSARAVCRQWRDILNGRSMWGDATPRFDVMSRVGCLDAMKWVHECIPVVHQPITQLLALMTAYESEHYEVARWLVETYNLTEASATYAAEIATPSA